jgi:hypothetical protein
MPPATETAVHSLPSEHDLAAAANEIAPFRHAPMQWPSPCTNLARRRFKVIYLVENGLDTVGNGTKTLDIHLESKARRIVPPLLVAP